MENYNFDLCTGDGYTLTMTRGPHCGIERTSELISGSVPVGSSRNLILLVEEESSNELKDS